MTLNPQQFEGEQLPMFMTARDIHRTITPGDMGGFDKPAQMWADKLAESKVDNADDGTDRTIWQSVKDEGVRSPVDIAHRPSGPMLWDGHHRVVSALNTDPDQYVPVLHEELGF